MSLNHFSSDLPEALWWAQHHHHHQQEEKQPIIIMEPNPNSSSSNIPHEPFTLCPNSPWLPQQSWPLSSYNPHQSMSSFPTQNTTLNFNLNHDDYFEEADQEDPYQQQPEQEQAVVHEHGYEEVEKEPMFEKPLTPSDVGKLNRLVIPKQHAEKYFPLGGGDSRTDKGLLLSFEDEAGKCWQFRYSYWNSSQSYVLTKGWSRYVKEKQLDVGDVVLFERHRTDCERMFIGWRRRGGSSISSSNVNGESIGVMVQGGSGGAWSRGLYSYPSGLQPYLASMQHDDDHQHGHGANVGTASVPCQPHCLHAGPGSAAQSQTMALGNSRRSVRLFGVNLECQLDESEPSTPDGSSLSSQGPAYQQFYSQSAYSSSSSTHSHMDFTRSMDVNQMRNRRG